MFLYLKNILSWIYITCDWELPIFFLSPHLMRNLHFEGFSLVALWPAVFFSLLHSKPRSRQSPGDLSFFQPLECLKKLLVISHVKEHDRGESGGKPWRGLFGTQTQNELRLIRRQCHLRCCVKYRKGTYRFDFGWFKPEAAPWDNAWRSFATHTNSFTLCRSLLCRWHTAFTKFWDEINFKDFSVWMSPVSDGYIYIYGCQMLSKHRCQAYNAKPDIK